MARRVPVSQSPGFGVPSTTPATKMSSGCEIIKNLSLAIKGDERLTKQDLDYPSCMETIFQPVDRAHECLTTATARCAMADRIDQIYTAFVPGSVIEKTLSWRELMFGTLTEYSGPAR
jgi:hypothetical protein